MPIGIMPATKKHAVGEEMNDPSPEAQGMEPVDQTDPEEGVAQQGQQQEEKIHDSAIVHRPESGRHTPCAVSSSLAIPSIRRTAHGVCLLRWSTLAPRAAAR